MKQPSVIHHTFVIDRSYPVPPERVFAAFSDPAQKRRWFGDTATTDVEEFEMDFRAGGKERTGYRLGADTPFPGTPLINDGVYQNIVPDQRVVIASSMTLGDKCISASLATFELLATDQGTDLIFTHQGAFFEGADGPEMRQGGWNRLLAKLAEELAPA